jgi:hypothetical protein
VAQGGAVLGVAVEGFDVGAVSVPVLGLGQGFGQSTVPAGVWTVRLVRMKEYP